MPGRFICRICKIEVASPNPDDAWKQHYAREHYAVPPPARGRR